MSAVTESVGSNVEPMADHGNPPRDIDVLLLDFGGVCLLNPVELRFRSVKGGAAVGGHGIETKKLRKRFRKLFEEELARSRVYTLTDQPGPGVLEVGAELIDLAVLGPDPGDANIVLIRTPSSMTLMLELLSLIHI